MNSSYLGYLTLEELEELEDLQLTTPSSKDDIKYMIKTISIMICISIVVFLIFAVGFHFCKTMHGY